MLRSLFTSGKDPVPTVQETGWVPGPVWTGVENFAPTGFDPRTVYRNDYLRNALWRLPTLREAIFFFGGKKL